MTLETLIGLSKEWRNMGDAVTEQAEAVLVISENMEEQNVNALRMVAEWLDTVSRRAAWDQDMELAEDAESRASEIREHLAGYELPA